MTKFHSEVCRAFFCCLRLKLSGDLAVLGLSVVPQPAVEGIDGGILGRHFWRDVKASQSGGYQDRVTMILTPALKDQSEVNGLSHGAR